MRGHAMFSAEERTLDEETLEYAWLVELTIGTLSGKLTTPQLQNIITALEAFIFTVEDTENSLRHPKPYMLCYHGVPQPQCVHTTGDHFCPTTDLIKYKMVRASIDGISLNLVESGTLLSLQVRESQLDWNLLSTASPSINAWMNPSDRLTVAVIHFLHASESRRLGVMASLMAEALDVQSIHVPIKNKYVKLMPLSQTLQEDPSCQLCNVLRRYLLQSSSRTIEANLLPPHLPKLATLRQGVVVLSRQWKNALYMPLLMEQTFRNKQTRPAFTFKSHAPPEGRSTPKFDQTFVTSEVTDEKTTLLEAEGGSLHSHPPHDSEGSGTLCGEDVTDGVMSSESTQLPPRKTLPSYPPRSSRASVILPVLNTAFESPAR
ncbi:uncharacterized protein E2C01_000663 [Portunus trituberculatus]|uniref:Bridge-like lipid transfer protein family member 1 middle region domain-containing protein n=1 Tax=Portunus trituberculatus TaxID=210409 RepID=A0A5B7CFS0_PORTR|nr:uncharacterized protein [Portunus trituberculatus]